MTDTAALDALIEAVEAGTLHREPYGGMPMATACYPRDEGGKMLLNTGGWSDGDCISAYHGDLNAAKALHEALLPGWGVQNLGSVNYDGSGGWVCRITGPNFLEDFQQESASANDPARAWLLATLKAHRASL